MEWVTLAALILFNSLETRLQGDQIGRIFAHWVIVGQFILKITEVARI
jgi:hypothetical protein